LGWNPLTGELWVVNNHTESATVLGGVGAALRQAVSSVTTIATRGGGASTSSIVATPKSVSDAIKRTNCLTAANRRDRGWYHYMARVSSISFDSRGQFATCQESENDYDLHDAPNFFMGPTLFDASDALLKRADGASCTIDDRLGSEPCYLAHIDMLHESPVCVGITHDAASRSPYDNVYWAVGTRFEPTEAAYSSDKLTLLRYDFEKPHGVGVLDHSQANVRRYHDVEVTRRAGVPGHLHADADSNALYVADVGGSRILAIDRRSGEFNRFARADQGGEFLQWSASEPRFEYSVYHCMQHKVFAPVSAPSGLAGTRHHLFVSDHDSGEIIALEKGTGREVARIDTGSGKGLMGLTIDPSDGSLWFVNSRTSEVGRVAALQQCPAGTGLDVSSTPPAEAFANEICSTPNTTALGNTVAHPNHDCSYINQSDMCLGEMYGSSRGDKCRGDGSYNLDMLLMTGHYCHKCLPSPCLNGGTCENIWNKGYRCKCAAGFEGDNCQHKAGERPADLPPCPDPEPLLDAAASARAPSVLAAVAGAFVTALLLLPDAEGYRVRHAASRA